jgi:hypothetical protein
VTTVLLFDVNETLLDEPPGAPRTLVAEDIEVLVGRLLDPDVAC